MQTYFPYLLTRKRALMFIGLTRRKLQELTNTGIVRVYKTKTGKQRYFRDDIIKFTKNEHYKE